MTVSGAVIAAVSLQVPYGTCPPGLKLGIIRRGYAVSPCGLRT
jgi:hypothetical protein